jgi:hypothetical protein
MTRSEGRALSSTLQVQLSHVLELEDRWLTILEVPKDPVTLNAVKGRVERADLKPEDGRAEHVRGFIGERDLVERVLDDSTAGRRLGSDRLGYVGLLLQPFLQLFLQLFQASRSYSDIRQSVT